tara:strand:+ start:560 stop:2284 length:1725 start_codon:yes stop_codon:yes gene_type:complete
MFSFKKIFNILGEFKSKIPFISFIILFNSILDVIGISLLPILINIILTSQNETYYLNSIKIDISSENFLGIFCLSVAIFFMIKSIISFFINRNILSFAYSLRKKIILKIINNYMNLNFENFFKKKSSDLILNSVTHVGLFTDGVVLPMSRAISEILVVIGLFIILSIENYVSMLILMSIIFFIFLIYFLIIRIRLFVYGKLMSSSEGNIIKNLNYIVDGFREIKLLNKENYFRNSIFKSLETYESSGVNSRSIQLLPRYFFELAIVIFVMGLIYFSKQYNLIESENLITLLGLFVIASIRIIPSISTISLSISTMRSSAYAIEKLHVDLREDKKKYLNLSGEHFDFHRFETRNLSFKYESNSSETLDGINFDFFSGEIIGLYGDSGSGKSTFIDIIIGLLNPSNGSLNIFDKNGVNILKKDKANIKLWQDKIAYIPQQTFLVDEDVQTNISLEEDKKNIDIKNLKYSLEKSLLEDIFNSNKDFSNKKIGERGEFLSGGQRQRLAFARSLYTKRKIFVLDEITSSLDKKTEKEIYNFIHSLKGEFTIIIISHNINMLNICDRLYELKNKKILRIK